MQTHNPETMIKEMVKFTELEKACDEALDNHDLRNANLARYQEQLNKATIRLELHRLSLIDGLTHYGTRYLQEVL